MPENQNKFNLDQLLEIKRAEKPSSPEFWEGFQKEFRQRQLQTLIAKETFWSRLPRVFFARSSVLVPLSAVSVALFVLVVNFQDNSPLHNEYFEATTLVNSVTQSTNLELTVEPMQAEPVVEAQPVTHAIASPASFVMDVIPANQPESLSYTREFPTSTFRSDNRAVSALVSFTIARDTPAFGMAGRSQTIGF